MSISQIQAQRLKKLLGSVYGLLDNKADKP